MAFFLSASTASVMPAMDWRASADVSYKEHNAALTQNASASRMRSSGLLRSLLQKRHQEAFLTCQHRFCCRCRPDYQGDLDIRLHLQNNLMLTLISALLSTMPCRRSAEALACTVTYAKHICHQGTGPKRMHLPVCCMLHLESSMQFCSESGLCLCSMTYIPDFLEPRSGAGAAFVTRTAVAP